jgi:hypothetical protein
MWLCGVVIYVVICCRTGHKGPPGSHCVDFVHVDITWMSRGLHVFSTWMSRECHVAVTWVSCGCHVNITWLSRGNHVDVR